VPPPLGWIIPIDEAIQQRRRSVVYKDHSIFIRAWTYG
jgi:hypothetical protein